MSYFYKPFQSLLFILTLLGMPAISLAAPVSIVIDGVTYTADDSNVPAGAAAAAYDSSFGTSVSLPETITIGGQSYAVTSIGGGAFENKGLTAVNLPDNLINIGFRAFYDNSLTSVVIPDNITLIDGYAFDGNNLTSVTIGASVTTIEGSAFSNNNLTSIIIPASVTFIDDYAFSSNPLTEVWFDGNAPRIIFAPFFSTPTVYYNCAATGFTPPLWNGYPLGTCFNKVEFDSQGGNVISEQRVLNGNSATEPTPPTRSGYTFDGWYHDAAGTTPYDFSDIVTSNTTIYAAWKINQYTVTFSEPNGSVISTQTLNHGDTVTQPLDPIRTGYTFDGWYHDAAGTNPYDFSLFVNGNLTLFAQWMQNPPQTSVNKIPTLSKSALIGLFIMVALLGLGLLRHNRGKHC